MAFDLNSLTAYTDEQKMPLIKKSILEGRTAQLISVQPDIKNSATINIINSTMVGQSGACGWSPSGSTALTQRTISVCNIKFEEALCLLDLDAYYTSKMMKPGSYNTEIPFEGIFAEEKAEKLQAIFEDIIWKGDSDDGSGNLALCDGFLKLFDEVISGSTVNGNPLALTAITPANIVNIVDGMAALVPTDVIAVDDLHIFVGYDFYRTYAKALRDQNLFHYNGTENQGMEFSQMVPGTNIRIVAVRGLNGTNRAVLTPASNLYLGTDLLNDFENFELFYYNADDEIRFRSKFRMGVEVAFPEFIVDFKLA
jgi:hypothetical protein